MKLQVMSDIHLEFHPTPKHWDGVYTWQIPETDADVIVLAGDTGMRFTPGIARRLHLDARRWLEERLAQPFPGPTVVVTHHAPSNLGQHERYRNGPLAPSFVSDLSALMDPTKVALWIHGHTHYCSRYKVAGVPVVTNQAGYYQIEEVLGFDPALVVELPRG